MIHLIFLIGVIYAQKQSEGIQLLEIGKTVTGFVSPYTQNYQIYQLVVPQLNQTNLIVMIKGQNPGSDPNIYISKNQHYTFEKDADVEACEAQGLDICVINYQDVEENSSIYLGVVSQFPVRYSLRIDIEKDLQLKQNDFLSFKVVSENQVSIINFKLAQIDLEQTEIEVIVQVMNQDQLEEPFYVYMNEKENGVPSNTNYDYLGIDTWDDKKVIEFRQEKSYEEFIIMIYAEKGANIYVSSIQSSDIKQLNLYDVVQQVVEEGDLDLYVLNIEKQQAAKCDYAFTFIPYQGSAKLYINLNSQPPLLENYEWQEDDKQGYQILITNEELTKKNVEFKQFYIAIYGEDYCTYQLNIQCYDFSQSVIMQHRTQYIRNLKNYQIANFTIPFSFSSKQLIVQAKIFFGKINFLITNCHQDFCNVDQDIFENYNQFEDKYNFTFISPQQQSFEFRLNSENYSQWRIFTQLDKSISVDRGHFSISYHKLEDQLLLQENTPHKSYVSYLERKYYKFFISENDKILRLSFLLTKIEGKATIFVSKNNQKPGENDFEFKSNESAINLGGRFGSPPDSGTYYITILGNSECKFTITTWVIRNLEDFGKFGKFPWHYVQLNQGDPQEHQIENDQVALFKIDLVSYQVVLKRSIVVKLQTTFGRVEMLGFDHPEFNEEKYQWKSSYQIQIDNDDKNYPKILYLRVRIKNLEFSSLALFRLAYHYQSDSIQLFENEQFFNYIQSNEEQSYTFSFKPGEDHIITKSAEKIQTALIFNLFEQVGIKFAFSHNSNSFLVQSDENFGACTVSGCQSSIIFSIQSKMNQFYSLIVSRRDQNEILLIESQALSKNVPKIEDNFYFYVQTSELSIVTFSYSKRMQFYAKIIFSQGEKHYPNRTQYDKVSKSSGSYVQSQIYFSKIEMQQHQCSEHCLVLLTVFSLDDIVTEEKLFEYTISFNQNFSQLREAEIYYGQVEAFGYRYFSFWIPTEKDEANLMIMLNPSEHCDANLYISKNKFPNMNSFDWKSDLYLGDVIVIEAGNSIYTNMSGQYYIGVTAKSNCSFIIQYKLGNYKMFDIQFNVPTTLSIKEGEIVYFVQQIFDSTDKLTIFFESPSQTATFFVDKLEAFEQDLTNFKFNNNKQGYSDFLIIQNHSEDRISYLIAIKGYTNEKVMIQTTNSDQFILMNQGKIYCFYLKQNEEKYLQINPNTEKIVLHIIPRQGLIDASYFYKDLTAYDPGVTIYNVLTVQNDWTKNQFEIENKYNYFVFLKLSAEIEDSIFKIWYVPAGKIEKQKISSIYPQYVYLFPQKEEQFIYSSLNSNPEKGIRKTIQVTLFLHPEYQTLTKQHKLQKPNLDIYSRTSTSQLSHIYEASTPDLLYKEYEDKEQEYEIRIQNNNEFDQGYMLQVSTSDLRPLIPKFKQFGKTTPLQSNYFFYSQQVKNLVDQYLFYEMQFCDGLYHVFTALDQNKLKDGRYDTQIEINQNKLQYGFINFVYGQILYLKIQMYKKINEQSNQGQFTIKIYEVNQEGAIPYDKIYPGEQGYLAYQLEELEELDMINLIVNYAPLDYSKAEKEVEFFTVENIEYYLLLQSKEDLADASFNYCIEPYHQLRFIQGKQSNYTTITTKASINYQEGVQSYVFTILAKAHVTLVNDQKITLDYYYEPRNIKWDNIKQLNGPNIWQKFQVISIVIFSLIIVFALIVFFKLRIKKKGQQYEFNDSQPPRGLEMQYRNLS